MLSDPHAVARTLDAQTDLFVPDSSFHSIATSRFASQFVQPVRNSECGTESASRLTRKLEQLYLERQESKHDD